MQKVYGILIGLFIISLISLATAGWIVQSQYKNEFEVNVDSDKPDGVIIIDNFETLDFDTTEGPVIYSLSSNFTSEVGSNMSLILNVSKTDIEDDGCNDWEDDVIVEFYNPSDNYTRVYNNDAIDIQPGLNQIVTTFRLVQNSCPQTIEGTVGVTV